VTTKDALQFLAEQLGGIQQKLDDIEGDIMLVDCSAEIEELKDSLEARLTRIEAALAALTKLVGPAA
jgi:hypothetical protein